jgi:hypothetical protein
MNKIGAWLLWACVVLSILFITFSSSFIYKLTNILSTTIYLPETYNLKGSTVFGQIVHSTFFGLIIYFVLQYIYYLFTKPTEPTLSELKSKNGGIVPID